MGLDMYAYITDTDVPEVAFEQPDDAILLFCWRKHPNLHGWMERLYRKKGGDFEDFNLETVRLDAADIDALERDVVKHRLPGTVGFFFGRSRPEDQKHDMEFIHRARDALARGKRVFYIAWW